MELRLSDARMLMRPYYFVRLVLIACYFVGRQYYPRALAQKPSSFLPAGMTQEVDMLILVAMIVGQRLRNAASFGEIADTVVFYSLALEAVLLYLTDLSAFLRFVFIFAALKVILARPAINCADLIRRLSPLDALKLLPSASVVPDRRVGDKGHGYPADEAAAKAQRTAAVQGHNGSRTIVVVGTHGTDHVLGVVATIARERREARRRSPDIDAPDPVSFAYIDAARYGDVVSSDLGVDAGLFSMQLPSVLEISEGRVVRRLPPVGTDGTVSTVKLDYNGLRRFFSLD